MPGTANPADADHFIDAHGAGPHSQRDGRRQSSAGPPGGEAIFRQGLAFVYRRNHPPAESIIAFQDDTPGQWPCPGDGLQIGAAQQRANRKIPRRYGHIDGPRLLPGSRAGVNDPVYQITGADRKDKCAAEDDRNSAVHVETLRGAASTAAGVQLDIRGTLFPPLLWGFSQLHSGMGCCVAPRL